MIDHNTSSLYIGLMSGTSLDGVDGVLVELPTQVASAQIRCRTLATAYFPFSDDLRGALMALQVASGNEIEREALAAHALAYCYADCVSALLQKAKLTPDAIRAIGAHGQTIRHRPELAYTRQTNNPALLAELTGIDVIADLRSRDVAAGGQGAPLVPAFHHALFGQAGQTRVVVNIGGVSNISVLKADGTVTGCDTGPGNVLMDAWIKRQLGHNYDTDGAWANSGVPIQALLDGLNREPYLALAAPKSTGRDLFNAAWLAAHLSGFGDAAANDVQATLTRFTADTIAAAIGSHADDTRALYVCGGGAYNACLMEMLTHALRTSLHTSAITVESTAVLGVAPNHVEALAFAWLAQRFVLGLPGNLPAVTGAKGLRRLGALYPA
jgi:anhydro-N-acetylmuramic acid kinase